MGKQGETGENIGKKEKAQENSEKHRKKGGTGKNLGKEGETEEKIEEHWKTQELNRETIEKLGKHRKTTGENREKHWWKLLETEESRGKHGKIRENMGK